MVRVFIGAVAAAVAMLVIGFIFFATPLARIAMGSIDDGQAAAVQQTLAASLPRTGTYAVPGMDTAAQTNMYSQGPIATIHYTTGGFAAPPGAAAIVGGLVLNFVVALLIGAALIGIDRRVPDFGSRARAAVIVAVAAAAFCHLGEPVWMHHDWPHFIYVFVADSAMLAAAGLIVAWSLPRSRAAPEEAPTDV